MKTGEPKEILRGVYLLRMPLPFRLDHINLYLIEDQYGWTIVDCGLNSDETVACWEGVLSGLLSTKPVQRIIVTHLHPDHIGLAAWLSSRCHAPVYMSSGEWGLARKVFDLPEKEPEKLLVHYRRMGLDGDILKSMVTQASTYRKLIKKLPDEVNLVSQGEAWTIGGRKWEVKIGRGHSPECICLWNQETKTLIAGDHVLPSISPNVSLLSVGPENPLHDYLASLNEFIALNCETYLPAHGLPCEEWGTRISDLVAHHGAQINLLGEFCQTPRSVHECAREMFGDELPPHQMYFALGEAAAHLVYMVSIGRMELQGDLPWKFRASMAGEVNDLGPSSVGSIFMD